MWVVSRCSPSILPQYESVNGPSYLHSAIFTGKVDFVITARVSRKGCRGGNEKGGGYKVTKKKGGNCFFFFNPARRSSSKIAGNCTASYLCGRGGGVNEISFSNRNRRLQPG